MDVFGYQVPCHSGDPPQPNRAQLESFADFGAANPVGEAKMGKGCKSPFAKRGSFEVSVDFFYWKIPEFLLKLSDLKMVSKNFRRFWGDSLQNHNQVG